MIVYTHCGTAVLIDDDDFELYKSRSWTWNKAHKTPYVRSRLTINGKREMTLLHRFIMSASKGDVVDHINRNVLDNRKENLRICTFQQNTWNRVQPNKTTGLIGVRKVTATGWYASYIGGGRPGERRHLKSSRDPIECAKAYDAACKAERGEFAVLNFPEDYA